VGLTVIGNSREEAEDLNADTLTVLDREASYRRDRPDPVDSPE